MKIEGMVDQVDRRSFDRVGAAPRQVTYVFIEGVRVSLAPDVPAPAEGAMIRAVVARRFYTRNGTMSQTHQLTSWEQV